MKLLPRLVATYAVASWVVALAVSPLQHQAVQLSAPDTHSITLLGEEPSTDGKAVVTRTVAASKESLTATDRDEPSMSRGVDGGRSLPKGKFNELMLKREQLIGVMRAIKSGDSDQQLGNLAHYKATKAQLAHVESEMGIPKNNIADAKSKMYVALNAGPKYHAEYNQTVKELDQAHAQGHAVPTGEYKKYIVNAGHSADQLTDSADKAQVLRTNEQLRATSYSRADKDNVDAQKVFQYQSEGAARPAPAFVDGTSHSLADMPGAPRGISVNYIHPHSITLTWMAPELNRALLTGYTIFGRPTEGVISAFKPLAVADGGVNQIMKKVRKLQAGIKYEVKIQADYVPHQIREMTLSKLQEQMQLHGKGSLEQYEQGDKNKLMIQLAQIIGTNQGPFSNITTLTTKASAPDPPADVVAILMRYRNASKELECTLQWTAPASNGALITGYRILRMQGGEVGGWAEVVSNTASSTTQHVMTGLEPGGYEYFFRVYAINSEGKSKHSVQTTGIRSLYAKVPGPPQELASKNMLCKVPDPPELRKSNDPTCNFDLSWQEPSGRGREITGYKIMQRVNHRGQFKTNVHTKSAKPHVLLGLLGKKLKPGTHYAFKVAGINELGLGVFSPILEMTTSTSEPSAPEKPVWGNVTDTTLTLSWNEPPSNGAPIIGYSILFQEGGAGGYFIKVANTQSTDTAAVVTGLTTGGFSYEFQVLAINSAGKGTKSPTSDPVQTAYSSATAAQVAARKAEAAWKANHVIYTARQLKLNWEVTKDRLKDMTIRFRTANEIAVKSQHKVAQLQGQQLIQKDLADRRMQDERSISMKQMENKDESAGHWQQIRRKLDEKRLIGVQKLASVRIQAERIEQAKVVKSNSELVEDLRDQMKHVKLKLTLANNEVKKLKYKINSGGARLKEAGPKVETILPKEELTEAVPKVEHILPKEDRVLNPQFIINDST